MSTDNKAEKLDAVLAKIEKWRAALRVVTSHMAVFLLGYGLCMLLHWLERAGKLP